MKKYLAIALIIISLIFISCAKDSVNENESINENESNSSQLESNDKDTTESDSEVDSDKGSDEYVEYTYLTVSKDPVYDKTNGILALYFTDYFIWQNTDSECTVGIITDDGATSIKSYAAYDIYPDMNIDTDLYSGVALKLSEKIEPGEYMFSVVFGDYMANFQFTVE